MQKKKPPIFRGLLANFSSEVPQPRKTLDTLSVCLKSFCRILWLGALPLPLCLRGRLRSVRPFVEMCAFVAQNVQERFAFRFCLCRSLLRLVLRL